MAELKQSGINTESAILDTRDYNEDSIREHIDSLECKENFVSDNVRHVYIKCVESQLESRDSSQVFTIGKNGASSTYIYCLSDFKIHSGQT